MIDAEEYSRLKKRAEKARSEADRAQGVLDEQLKKLRSDFNVETLEAAEELVKKFEKEEQEAEKKYREELKTFEEKWGEKM